MAYIKKNRNFNTFCKCFVPKVFGICFSLYIAPRPPMLLNGRIQESRIGRIQNSGVRDLS